MGQSTRRRFDGSSRKQVRQRKNRRRRSVSYVVWIAVLGLTGWATSSLWQPAQSAATTTSQAGREKTILHHRAKGARVPTPNKGATSTPGLNSIGNAVSIGLNSTGNSTLDNSTNLPASAMITVPAQNQNPQLPNGCEVTSLSMLFNAIGHPVSKMTLAKEEPVDPTPLVRSNSGQIESWGNPNVGFVGSPYVWSKGFGIYHGPIIELIDEILPGQGVDLTKQPFQNLLAYVAQGTPVEAWVTSTLKPTNQYWVTWQTPEGPFHTTLNEHAVLIVGYDQTNIYINNPLNGDQQEAVKRSNFIGAWNQLGDQAVTIQTASRT